MKKREKSLKPIIYKDSWHKDIAKVIRKTFREVMYDPLLEAFDEADLKENAKKTPLEQALIDGSVQYVRGMFTGQMNAKLSKQIKELGGKFYRGKWRLEEARMTPELRSAIEKNRSWLQRLSDGITRRLSEMAENARTSIENMSIKSLGIYALDRTSEEFKQTVGKALSVAPQEKLKEEGKKLLQKDYVLTRYKPIKETLASQMEDGMKYAARNFAYEEIVKLRQELEKMIAAGSPRQSVRDFIEGRLDISSKRAKFIARQETSLYTSKLKEAQYKGADIKRYRWKTAGDRRVRPDHEELNNNEYSWDNPPSAEHFSTGSPCHPGEDYNCRCIAVPIVEW